VADARNGGNGLILLSTAQMQICGEKTRVFAAKKFQSET